MRWSPERSGTPRRPGPPPPGVRQRRGGGRRDRTQRSHRQPRADRALGKAAQGPVIVCLQAGNVNTGACDDLAAGIEVAAATGPGSTSTGPSVGLWAAASPTTRRLVAGIELADSWACDGHKWLNVPYDSGYVLCARPKVHTAAVSYTAAYLVGAGTDPPGLADLALESSRRARGFATWAAIRQLGRAGVAELIERGCSLARRFAAGLRSCGVEIANDVVLNQVLASFGDDARTDRVIAGIQQGRDLLDGRHHLEGPPAPAHLGLQLVHQRGRRRPQHRGHRAGRRPGGSRSPLTAHRPTPGPTTASGVPHGLTSRTRSNGVSLAGRTQVKPQLSTTSRRAAPPA